MLSNFENIIDEIVSENDKKNRTKIASEYLGMIDLKSLCMAFQNVYASDVASSLRQVVTNPPTIFPLRTYLGYSLEALMWYPQPSTLNLGSYETEDIHDHFGWIVSHMIVGDGYVEERFIENDEGVIFTSEKTLLKAGSTNVIAPTDIHKVSYLSTTISLSIRIIFPPCRPKMRIFEQIPIRHTQTIECSTERKAYELGAVLHTLDEELFGESIRNIESMMLQNESRRILSNLKSLAAKI